MKWMITIALALGALLTSSANAAEDRDYMVPVKEKEKKDIVFIMTSMANKPLTKLYKMKSSLQAAGDRINHLHPLRFLECVFTDEELKVCIRNIKDRGWVWSDFFGGLKNSLQEESSKDNMRDEFIADFCLSVNLEIDVIYNTVQQKRWSDLINLLIKHIPRTGDSERYNF